VRAPYLACGVAGPELEPEERRVLEELQPGAVVLFARNVAAAGQVRELVQALAELPEPPYVAVDLEGGRVNRLRAVIGELPAAAVAAAAGPEAVRALGAACGSACAALGIGVDFAPVLDVARDGGYLGGEDRCLGAGVSAVRAGAAAFLDGLEAYGVGACLKHFPGLGSGTVDSHAALPELDDRADEERGTFLALTGPRRAVMVAHALAPSLGDALRPASLSPGVIGSLQGVPCGPIIGDDLEMGALGGYGTLPERAAAALLAGCDQVLVCNALTERVATVEHLERWSRRSPELRAALVRAGARVGDYGRRPVRQVTLGEVQARVESCWQACGGRQ